MLLAAPAWAAPLQVVVTGIQSSKGDVMVAVCLEREFLQQHCTWNAKAPARPGQVTVVLVVPPGTYAVQAYQDEDRNGEVTLSMLGLPEEPMGFSNNPTIRFSAPKFRDSAIQVGPMGGRIEVALKKLF
jgi:uncharacterized protein (DUF2141 family)